MRHRRQNWLWRWKAPILVLLVAVLPAALEAQSKSLHWSRFNVEGRLDPDGRLHVKEKQSIVFNGDWNGGERIFRLPLGQSLQFHGVKRLDAAGMEHPLVEGDLSQVDHYRWTDSKTLRWRSRLPSDPPFADTEITYVLDYSLSDVLQPKGDHYVLNHDFAFPNREGVIERFTLTLEIDPAWQPLSTPRSSLELSNLPPGTGAIVKIPLRYVGAGVPAGVTRGVSPRVAIAIAAAFLLFALWRIVSFVRGERRVGRFSPLPDVDQNWLEGNLFKYPPEVVGAAWDETTGAAEVAAVLARMTLEGKLASRVESHGFGPFRRNELHLTLKVDRKELSGYELALVKSLFISGDGTQTSTERIRKHYRSKGFDPVKKIRDPVKRMADALGGGKGTKRKVSPVMTLLLSVLGIALLAATVMTPGPNVIAAAAGFGIIMTFFIVGVIGSANIQSRVVDLGAHSIPIILAILLIVSGIVAFLLVAPSRFTVGLALLLGLPAFGLAAINCILNVAKIRHIGERLEVRRRLAGAREYFLAQLRSREPRLRDEWFPYLLAFGLGPSIDRWFRAFGGSTVNAGVGSHSHSQSSSSSIGGGWTGGGGSFGGGGASGTWAVAAGSLAAGVSPPGSSGGSSGGGGGSSSSGGGGGGGW